MEEVKKLLARALLGNGMAGSAADDMRLSPMYRQAQEQAAINGQQLPPYEVWKQMQMGRSVN